MTSLGATAMRLESEWLVVVDELQCVQGYDEVLVSIDKQNLSCRPLFDTECLAHYGKQRQQYDAALRFCISHASPLSFAQGVMAPTVDAAPVDDGVTASPMFVALPWMTDVWLSSANITTICGAHGTWNATVWWCDCFDGYSTDPTQNVWNATGFRWCSVPQRSSGGAGVSAEGSSNTLLSQWMEACRNGNSKTIAITVVALLVFVLIVYVVAKRIKHACMERRRRSRHRSRSVHRRRHQRSRASFESGG